MDADQLTKIRVFCGSAPSEFIDWSLAAAEETSRIFLRIAENTPARPASAVRTQLCTIAAAAVSVFAWGAPQQTSRAANLVLDEQFQTPQFTVAVTPARVLSLPDGRFVRFSGTDTLAGRLTGAMTRYFPDGTFDLSFSFSREYRDVTAATPAAGGKLMVAARHYAYGEAGATERVLRLNNDGSVDATFTEAVVGTTPSSRVYALVELPDGAVLVGGWFENFAGGSRSLVRLFSDGTLDTGFNPAIPPSWIMAITPLPDGKVLIGGTFTSVGGIARPGVARLNADGSLDTTFAPSGFTRTAAVRTLHVRNDGRVIAGGQFIWSGRRQPLIQLQSTGALDTTFATFTVGQREVLHDSALLADGRIVAAFARYLMRFQSNGSVDSSFAGGVVWDSRTQEFGSVTSVNLEADGQVLFGGAFDTVSGQTGNGYFGVGRADAAGNSQPLPALNEQPGRQVTATSHAWLGDGTAFAAFGAPFTRLHPPVPHEFVKLLADGSPAPGPALTSSDPASILTQGFVARDFTRVADGSFLVFGDRLNAPGETPFVTGKFLPDGAEETAYRESAVFGAYLAATAEPAGSALICGEDDPQAVIDTQVLARLRSSGWRDSFALDPQITGAQLIRDPNSGDLRSMHIGSRILAVQPDGRILFVYLSQDALWHLVRLHPDGTVDATFSETTLPAFGRTASFPYVTHGVRTYQPSGGVWRATLPLTDAELLPDGRILIAGRFTSFRGTPARGLVRLHPDGSVDPIFQTGGGAQWTQTIETATFFPAVEQVEAQTNGQLLIAGTFEAFNGVALPGIASLTADGGVDGSFTPPARRLKNSHSTTHLTRQPDGSFLLSGSYSLPNETEPRLIRIKSLGGIPVVGSPGIATAVIGRPFSYQIVASGQPTSYGATGLPPGFSFDAAAGLISGTATEANIGVHEIALHATSPLGASVPRLLRLTVPALPQLISAVSRLSHGISGEFEVQLPLSGAPGVEPRSAGSSSTFYVQLRTNHDISRGNVAITAGIAQLHYPTTLHDGFFLPLTNVANAQTVTVTVTGAVDMYGQPMPDTHVRIGFLLGDTNGNGVVNATDISQTKSLSGQQVTQANCRGDLNASGAINATDISIAKSAAGTFLPADTAPAEPGPATERQDQARRVLLSAEKASATELPAVAVH
jgi:uncharacterized delta-60 repeat protein